MVDQFTIGQIARATGCKVQTVRYYQQIGLVPPRARSERTHDVHALILGRARTGIQAFK